MKTKLRNLQFAGPQYFEEFWTLLEDESPRCAVIVSAVYLDERLGTFLKKKKDDFDTRIEKAFKSGLLSKNERHDLNIIRKLRNRFAHDLHAIDFDSARAKQVESLAIWEQALENDPQYAEWFPGVDDRFLFVAAVLAMRLQKPKWTRGASKPEPEYWRDGAFPIIT